MLLVTLPGMARGMLGGMALGLFLRILSGLPLGAPLGITFEILVGILLGIPVVGSGLSEPGAFKGYRCFPQGLRPFKALEFQKETPLGMRL